MSWEECPNPPEGEMLMREVIKKGGMGNPTHLLDSLPSVLDCEATRQIVFTDWRWG